MAAKKKDEVVSDITKQKDYFVGAYPDGDTFKWYGFIEGSGEDGKDQIVIWNDSIGYDKEEDAVNHAKQVAKDRGFAPIITDAM